MKKNANNQQPTIKHNGFKITIQSTRQQVFGLINRQQNQ